MRVAVETQGSRLAEWLRDVDRLVISPKPPSRAWRRAARRAFSAFMEQAATSAERRR